MITVPSRNEKISDDSGIIGLSWWMFLNVLTRNNPPQESSITVGASPFSYTARDSGNVLVTGGTVSAISLTRTSAHASGLTAGFIPVGNKDIVTVTYTVVPTMTFIP